MSIIISHPIHLLEMNTNRLISMINDIKSHPKMSISTCNTSNPDEIRINVETDEIYMNSLIKLCRGYGVDISMYHQVPVFKTLSIRQYRNKSRRRRARWSRWLRCVIYI